MSKKKMLKWHFNRSRNIVLLSSALALLFAWGGVAQAEVIRNFEVTYDIRPDSTIAVQEKIVYDFETEQRHGIFRDLYLTSQGDPPLHITVGAVSDENGNPLQYSTSNNGDYIQVKIGNPDALVTGLHTYVINYEVQNGMSFFEDHDEFYWDVTGNDWAVGIENVRASVHLPTALAESPNTDCFTGVEGSTNKNCQASFVGSAGAANGIEFVNTTTDVNFVTTAPLNSHEGLTVVVGLPLGLIDRSNAYIEPKSEGMRPYEWAMIIGFIGLWIGVAVFILRSKKQTIKPRPRIPKELKGQPIAVEYNPPNDLPPIEVGTLLDRKVDTTDISSVIIDLAVRGYLKIRYITVERPLWPDSKDYEFIKLKSGDDLGHPADKILFEFLFKEGETVTLSNLTKRKKEFYKEIEKIKKETEEHLEQEGYIEKGSTKREIKNKWIQGAASIGLFIGFVFMGSWGWAVFIPFLVLIIVLAISKNKLSTYGVATLAKILGFKEFLQLTEKDKLELLNAPELEPEVFEKFLPYAMVLGVEEKWAEKFVDIYQGSPLWYEEQGGGAFNSIILTHNLASFGNAFNQAVSVSSPRSSGFSGGSSGGGGGGGGGGSW
ncbi:MAG: DUF2207 domain-containing protein [bacterium]|nr:DUF2207 domain-containing protein [bacterium]